MVRDYRYDNGRDRRPKPPTLLHKVWDVLVLISTIVAALSLICALLAPHIEPSKSWVLPIFGLVIPIIYVTNIIAALYWIIKWRWRVALPIIALLGVGLHSISLFYNPQVTKRYDKEPHRNSIKVMSYNVRGFINDEEWWSTSDIAKYIDGESPDIVALQEINSNTEHFDSSFERVLERYHKVYYGSLAIYSRYPIINHVDLLAESDHQSGDAIYADINIKGDTVRVFNNHLHSTTIKASDDRYLSSRAIIRDSNRRHRLRNIINRYRDSAVERGAQANIITAATLSSPYEVIVCGDFNDTPMSYSYQTISQGLYDAFKECGEGYPFTYRGFHNILRIDYILSSRLLKPTTYTIDRAAPYSDHYPIIVHLERIKNN